MTDQIIDRNFLPTSTGGHATGQAGTTHSSLESKDDGIRNTVRNLFGEKIRMSDMMGLGNLDMHTGYDHTTTSTVDATTKILQMQNLCYSPLF